MRTLKQIRKKWHTISEKYTTTSIIFDIAPVGHLDPKFQVEGVAHHQPFFLSQNMQCMQRGLATRNLSVRPSVSVKRVISDKTKES